MWQRNMADADIIMLHHNMQYDAGIMLVKHQLNQLVSGPCTRKNPAFLATKRPPPHPSSRRCLLL